MTQPSEAMECLTINYLLDHSRFLSAALFLVQPLHQGWMKPWFKEQNVTAGAVPCSSRAKQGSRLAFRTQDSVGYSLGLFIL